MTPRKTALALTALQSHRSPLTLLQRRALILADGQRDLTALARLLGDNGAALVQTLCAMGYLTPADGSAKAAVPETDARTVGSTIATAPTVAQTLQALPTADDLHRQRRRAATNARLYLLDILQLQRNPAAAVLHRQLQAARADDAIGIAIGVALQELPQFTSASYAERVRARIGELLPEALQAA